MLRLLAALALLSAALGAPTPALFSAALATPAPRAARAAAGPLGRYSRARRLRELREDLSDAVSAQNFALASRLKAERDGLRAGDPVRDLRARLSGAVAGEDFAAASALRDELRSAQRASGSSDNLLFLAPDGKSLWVRGAELLLDELPDARLQPPVALQPDGLEPGSYRLQQPTWSPSGTRVAATLLLPNGGATGELVVFDAARGAELTRVSLPAPPFYHMWSADERYVTCLSATAGRLALLAVELRTGEVLTLARGVPLFYAMAGGAADRRLVAHNGGADAVQLLADYGPAPPPPAAPAAAGPWRTLAAPAGGFQSPWWSRWRAPSGALGQAIVFAERSRLVCVEPDARASPTTRRRVLYDAGADEPAADEGGDGGGAAPRLLLFVVARGAQAIALLSDSSETELLLLTPSARADVPCLLDVSSKVPPRADSVDLDGALPRGERVDAVASFFFSPGGRWLLVLARTSSAGSQARGAAAPAGWRWIVYDCEERRPFGASPSCELSGALAQQYVPFFTQFAQSVSPFSPDGGAFCYVTNEGGFVATLHPERAELAARVTITALPNKPARPDVMWWSSSVTDAADDELDVDDRRW